MIWINAPCIVQIENFILFTTRERWEHFWITSQHYIGGCAANRISTLCLNEIFPYLSRQYDTYHIKEKSIWIGCIDCTVNNLAQTIIIEYYRIVYGLRKVYIWLVCYWKAMFWINIVDILHGFAYIYLVCELDVYLDNLSVTWRYLWFVHIFIHTM